MKAKLINQRHELKKYKMTLKNTFTNFEQNAMHGNHKICLIYRDFSPTTMSLIVVEILNPKKLM